jgi:DNA repair exonuclease SbcCD ATPase subunit
LKWLKDVFSGRNSDSKELCLKLSETGAWLNDRSRDPGFEKRLEDIYRRMDEIRAELSKDVKSLNSAEPDKLTPPKLLRAGLAARGEVVKQMNSLVDKLVPPKVKDIESASEHHWALVKGLERTVTTFGRAKSYVAALFPKIIESINSDLTKVSRLLVELEEVVGKRRKEQEEIWYSRDLVVSIQEALASNKDRKASLKDNEENLFRQKASLKNCEEEMKKLAESAEGREVEDLKNRLDHMRQEQTAIEAEMADLVAPLAKAMTRMMKQEASSRLTLQHRTVLELLSTSPQEAPNEDIGNALEELRTKVAALGLKDRKKERTLEHVDHLIEKRSLEDLKSRHSKLEEEIRNMEQRIESSSRSNVLLKEEASRTRKAIRSIEADLAKGREDVALLEEKVRRETSELRERLSRLAGRPVQLDLQGEEPAI